MSRYFQNTLINVRIKLGHSTEHLRLITKLIVSSLAFLPQVNNGEIYLELEINSIYTLTTLTSGAKGFYDAIPPSKPFPVPYAEDFECEFNDQLLKIFISSITDTYEIAQLISKG